MNILRKLWNKLSGKKANTTIALEMKFHKETNPYGTHGTLVASSKEQGLVNASVRFVFLGVTVPPPLTPEMINFIWEEAAAQGYIAHTLLAYGRVIVTDPNASNQFLVSAKQRQQDAGKLIPIR